MVYIDHPSTDASFNFALEEYAMDTLDMGDEYFLFWRTTPTLMIGRYQNTRAEINMDYAEKNNINIVRRITGGGSIYTDLNGWQFSFITKNPDGKTIDFAHFTKPIIDALASLGATTYLSGRNDLLIDGKKISGNAQYKNAEVNLHHGSLLFNTDLESLVRALTPDDEKLISKGIQSVKQRVTNIADYLPNSITSEDFAAQMIAYLTEGMTTYHLTDDDIDKVNAIKAQQFDTWAWNFGKSPTFNLEKSGRFAGGKLTACTNVEKGIITDIAFYGDFFAQGDIDTLRAALIGTRHQQSGLYNALIKAHADTCIFQVSLEEILSLII